jgi:hypothetical protein
MIRSPRFGARSPRVDLMFAVRSCAIALATLALLRVVSAADGVPADDMPVENSPAWIVNRKNKLPKLTRLVAPHEKVRVEVYDLAGKKLFERDDVLHRRTDLNAELKACEYRLKFFAPDGKQITLMQEVGEVLLLK